MKIDLYSLDKHLTATLTWLAHAQDTPTKKDQGISTAYYLYKGWGKSYPETTGYIINTFLKYGKKNNESVWLNRATKAGEWLLTTQINNQGFPGGYTTKNVHPRVFNTGMILFGLAELGKEINDFRYLDAGKKALNWLIDTQDSDGTWTSISPEKKPYSYHSRVAWGMLEMAIAANLSLNEKTKDAVNICLEWVCKQQNKQGWFHNNGLITGLPPLTHNIAYTIRGLLEAGIILKNQTFIDAALFSAQKLLNLYTTNGYLYGGYNANWEKAVNFRCLTGDAQIGLIWNRIYSLTGDKKYETCSINVAQQIAKLQLTNLYLFPGINGGIPGAFPIWGNYLKFAYPNWAAKFFADLLMAIQDDNF